MMRHFLLLMLPWLILTACKKEAPQVQMVTCPDELEIVEMYNCYIRGDYAAYVGHMASLDGQPASYRKQMADLMKQRHRQQEESESEGPLSCSVVKMEMHGEDYCDAFIEVKMRDRTCEQILLPLVKKDGVWRIK